MCRKNNKSIRASRAAVDKNDRLLQEINLLNLEALMFCTSKSERARIQKLIDAGDGGRIVLNREDAKGAKIEISFDPAYGVPGDLAYRVMQAGLYFISRTGCICSERGHCSYVGTVQSSKRELIRLGGRQWSGAKEKDDELYNAIMQLYHTNFTLRWYDKQNDREEELHLRPFVTAYFARSGESSRRSFDDCMFDLHPRIVEGYNNEHFRAFNMQRMLGLRPTASMLYKRLFLTFGFLKRKGIPDQKLKYEKDYEDMCAEWLIGHTPRKYLSKIKQEHLGGHLDALITCGLLRRYSIERKKGGEGSKIVCYPGSGFFEDFPLFYETAFAHMPIDPALEDRDAHEHMAVLGYFHAKCGRSHQQFQPMEVEKARALLKQFSKDEVVDLIDYALQQKARGVDAQVFGFVSGYVERWMLEREARMKRKAIRQAIDACTYCDASGTLRFQRSDGSWGYTGCTHNAEQIERQALKKSYRVERHF